MREIERNGQGFGGQLEKKIQQIYVTSEAKSGRQLYKYIYGSICYGG